MRKLRRVFWIKRRCLLGFLVLLILFLSLASKFQNQTWIVFGIGNPDLYGNVICWHTIEQWNGSAWVILQNVTTASNWTQRMVEDMPIRFQVEWRLNNTLASSESEAIEFTRILMNISGIWVNEEFNNTSVSSDLNFYYGVEMGTWNQTGKPEAGVTYDVATKYEAYY